MWRVFLIRLKSSEETGAVLIVAVMMLLLITLIGMAAFKTSNVERKITRNAKCQRIAFYNAEGAQQVAFDLFDELRSGLDPSQLPSRFAQLGFAGDGNAFWNEPVRDFSTQLLKEYSCESVADVVVPSVGNARLDIVPLTADMVGESIAARSGYEGYGKSVAAAWAGSYYVVAQGDACANARRQIGIRVDAVR